MEKKNLIVAITGASGAVYARRLLRAIPRDLFDVFLVASEAGQLVYELETGRQLCEDVPRTIRIFDASDFTAPFASGSFHCVGMVVVPCTMGTLGAIAGGLSQNLIHRAADVCLKERRPLILVPREAPLATHHLENLARLSGWGALVIPAAPGFYHRPRSVGELVDFLVQRICDHLGVGVALAPRWEGTR